MLPRILCAIVFCIQFTFSLLSQNVAVMTMAPGHIDTTFKVHTEGTGTLSTFFISNPASIKPAMDLKHMGNGIGLKVRLDNPSGHANAFDVISQTSGNAIFSRSEKGVAGKFEIMNSSNSSPVLMATTTGLGTAFYVSSTNTGVTGGAIEVVNAGWGAGINVYSEKGKAANFIINTPNGLNEALLATTLGEGNAARFRSEKITGTGNTAVIEQLGKGFGLQISMSNATNNLAGLDVTSAGDRGVNAFVNGKYAISGSSQADGGIGVEGYTHGEGLGVKGSVNQQEALGVGVYGVAAFAGVKGESKGLGSHGIGVLGIGEVGDHSAIGVKGISSTSNPTSGSVTGINSGEDGIGVYGQANSGYGVKGNSASPTHAAVYGENHAGGEAVYGFSSGPSSIGIYGLTNATSGTIGVGVTGHNFNEGDGVKGISGEGGSGVAGWDGDPGVGNAGFFKIGYAPNTNHAVVIENNGLGESLHVQNFNASNTEVMTRYKKSGSADFAVYEYSNGDNKIRFDHTGKGFFDGGTQTGGADIAEVFDVEDHISAYEPGDVLAISTEKDRTVTKSAEAYSTLVAGVFATKPGVLMTEEQIDADLSGKVPMGVVGVIPTKICLEGGAIERGDLLVTSSTPGVAMKGDPKKIRTGQVLGKALENYSSHEIGLIRVLVNVK